MAATYWNPLLAHRVATVHKVARYVDRPDGRYERMVDVVATTDRSSGLLFWTVEVGEQGPGRGMTPQHYGTYPYGAREHAVGDAVILARHFGLQARMATQEAGWLMVRTDASAALDEPTPVDPTD